MIRSLLFAPGDSEKKMTKASEGDADVVILDLEDSVSESQKVIARGMVTEFLKAKSEEVKPRLYVRINPLDTEYCLSDIADVVTGALLVFYCLNAIAEVIYKSYQVIWMF